MRGAEHHHAEVHPEVEHAEDLRLSEAEHKDAADLGEGDAGEDLRGNRDRVS